MLFFVMMILGGPGRRLKLWETVMRDVGKATPIWYVIELFARPWLGFGWQVSLHWIVGGITLVATAITVKFFKGTNSLSPQSCCFPLNRAVLFDMRFEVDERFQDDQQD